jgi:magnesium-transporting ATPase (P-type)
MNGEMPSITNLLLLLSLMQSLVFLPAASAVSSSFHGQPTSRLPPSSSKQLHRLRPLRYPSSSSSLAFSIARRTNYVHNAESSKTASIRAASINSHFKQPVRTNFRGSSRRSGIGGSIDDVDYHNMDSSTDDNIPYEILPLTEVIRYLAPPPSSSHDRYNSNMDNAYNIGPDSGNVGNRFDDGNGSRKGDMESPIPSLPLLSEAQAHQRLQQFGPNILPSTRKQLSLWEIWWKQFEEDVLAKILACAALVSVLSSVSDVWNDVNSSIDSAAAGGAVGWGGVGGVVDISSSLVHSLIEPLAIIAILVLNAGVGAWQEVSARRSLEALEAMQPRVATVLRRYDDDNAGNDADDDATITNISDHNDRFNVPSTTNTEMTTTATTTTIATTPTKATARWIPNYDATHLVPGDVIRLRAGNAIPADSRLLSLQSSSASLTSYSSYSSLLSSPSSSTSYSSMDVDESSLTGESGSVMKFPGDNIVVPAAGSVMQNDNHTKKSEDEADDDDGTSSIEHELAPGATATITTTMPVPIQDQSSMLFSGCLVTRGSGTALVVRTGPNTQMGKIRSATIEAESEGAGRRTPLGDQLQQFGHVLSYAIGGICIAIWIASIPHFSDPAFASSMEGAVYYAKVGVALGVAAIPEGLPSAITLCLSLGARRMAGRNAIVRRLASVETLGCTSVICTDKTGTCELIL